MEAASLLATCSLAFLSVFVLLSLMAAAMHLTTKVFPEQVVITDPAVVAAISSVVAAVLPGARVTKVEEDS